MRRQLILTFLFFCSCVVFVAAQEICDNGIDDDGDGLIDLNDDDCDCELFIPTSLIPNPSFEDFSCCPNQNAQLNCADGWIQASNPTTDYVHQCGTYTGNTNIGAVAPTPYPDGLGAVGFRDGQNSVGPNYKEYVGACLLETMEAGLPFRLDFFVGFRDNIPGNGSFDMAVFGGQSCDLLPFGGFSNTIGCPANTGDFVQLGFVTVSGNNEWVNVIIDFVPNQDYNVLILGPACAGNPNFLNDPYFYVDRLALAETSEFGFALEEAGKICENDLVLSTEEMPGSSYQWYKNGVALVGETNPELNLAASIPNVEGLYSVIVVTAGNCSRSGDYEVRVPPYYSTLDATICDSEFLMVGTEMITQEGYQEITILAEDGCDSIIQLTLEVQESTEGFLDALLCQGSTYEFFDIVTDEPGIYTTTIMNVAGCDSIITLDLQPIDPTNGVEVESEFEIDLGESLDIIPSSFDPRIINFQWNNSNGITIGNDINLYDLSPTETSTYYLNSTDEFGCSIIDTVLIRVDKENIKIFVPNIFTPNEDGINDIFKFYPTIALESVRVFAVYDRWGEKVFEATDITEFDDFRGWNGRFKDRKAMVGVYAWMMEVEFLDNSSQLLKGSITLIR